MSGRFVEDVHVRPLRGVRQSVTSSRFKMSYVQDELCLSSSNWWLKRENTFMSRRFVEDVYVIPLRSVRQSVTSSRAYLQ